MLRCRLKILIGRQLRNFVGLLEFGKFCKMDSCRGCGMLAQVMKCGNCLVGTVRFYLSFSQIDQRLLGMAAMPS